MVQKKHGQLSFVKYNQENINACLLLERICLDDACINETVVRMNKYSSRIDYKLSIFHWHPLGAWWSCNCFSNGVLVAILHWFSWRVLNSLLGWIWQLTWGDGMFFCTHFLTVSIIFEHWSNKESNEDFIVLISFESSDS